VVPPVLEHLVALKDLQVLEDRQVSEALLELEDQLASLQALEDLVMSMEPLVLGHLPDLVDLVVLALEHLAVPKALVTLRALLVLDYLAALKGLPVWEF
jgi:hypothetical protein